MSSKVKLIVLAAVLAVAMAGVMATMDDTTDASSDDDIVESVHQSVPEKKEASDHINETIAKPKSSEPEKDSGGMLGSASSQSSSASQPPAPSNNGARSQAQSTPQGPQGPTMGQKSSSPKSIDIPKKDVPPKIDGIVKDYEEAFTEKMELESNGEPVIVIDHNIYTGEEAVIVSAMQKVMDNPDFEADFLVQVIDVLESEGEFKAADTVRTILDSRFEGVNAVVGLQQSGSNRSKDGSDDEEDDMNDPVTIEDVDDEEEDAVFVDDAPSVSGVSVFADPMSADMHFCVRYDDRGSAAAI
jgi:hypothetical protein